MQMLALHKNQLIHPYEDLPNLRASRTDNRFLFLDRKQRKKRRPEITDRRFRFLHWNQRERTTQFSLLLLLEQLLLEQLLLQLQFLQLPLLQQQLLRWFRKAL